MHGLHHKWDLQKMGWDSYGIPWRGAFLLDSFLKIWNHQPSSTPIATWPMIRTIIWQSILTGKWKDVESVLGLSGYFTLAWYLARTMHGITGCLCHEATDAFWFDSYPIFGSALAFLGHSFVSTCRHGEDDGNQPKSHGGEVDFIHWITRKAQRCARHCENVQETWVCWGYWNKVFLPQSITSCGRCLNSGPTIEHASSRKYTKDIHVYGDDIIGAGKLFYASKSQKPYTWLDRCSGKDFCGWKCFDMFSVCQLLWVPLPKDLHRKRGLNWRESP